MFNFILFIFINFICLTFGWASPPALPVNALLHGGTSNTTAGTFSTNDIKCYPMAYDVNRPRVTSGSTTMTETGFTTSFTTSAATSLSPGDIIIPNTSTGEARMITNANSATSYRVAPAFENAVTAETYTIRKGVAPTSSGTITMTSANGASTFTTSGSITLEEDDFIAPIGNNSQGRKVIIGGTGTSFTVTPAFSAVTTNSVFNIFKGKYLNISPWVPQSSNIVWHWGMHGPKGPFPTDSVFIDYIGSGNTSAKTCYNYNTAGSYDKNQGGVGGPDATVLALRGENVDCGGGAISKITNNITVGGWIKQYAEESGSITMTATNGATTFTTTGTLTLAVGDYIVPYTASSRQWRKINVGATGTSFTVTPAFSAAVTASKFRIFRLVQSWAGSPYGMNTTSAPYAGWSILNRSGFSETTYASFNTAKTSDGTPSTVDKNCNWSASHRALDGDWHHLMMTITGTITTTPGAGTGTIKLYFDGNLSSTCTFTGAAGDDFGAGIASGTGKTYVDTTFLFRKNSNSTASPTYFAEWTVWNTVLTANEIAKIYIYQNCFNKK